jgi:copper oxidase (laccase) domain-containing protein
MNRDFVFRRHQGIELLVYEPWWSAGLMHGMTTRQLSFRGASACEDVAALCSAVGMQALAVPQQCHGTRCLDLRAGSLRETLLERHHGDLCRFEQGDALLAPALLARGEVRMAFGVMSADCVPVVVRGEQGWALIHAGWRGLAAGIIKETLSALGEPLEGAVFASAGPARYEVGFEVVDAIGPTAVFNETLVSGGTRKAMLDTAATAINQLREYNPAIRTSVSGICTISEPRMHSFRRDGETTGRAVTFFLPPTCG